MNETRSWHNWSGDVVCRPARRARPATVVEMTELVRGARADGLPVRCVGAGHSFTPAAATDGVLIELDDLAGIESIVPHRGPDGIVHGADVTMWAGTRLRALGPLLWDLGLAQANLGDFDGQSISGAISTGTHGTGLGHGGLATTVVGLQLITADGSVLECDAEREPEVFEAARLGLGAFGLLSTVTVRCVPAFALHAQEGPDTLEAVLADLPGLARETDHVEFFWFPHTGRISVKRNTRMPADTPLRPVGRMRARLEDEFLANEGLAAVSRLCARRPALTPRVNRVTSRLLSARTYTDRSYRVFASARRVRFREMEYAVPLEAAAGVLADLRRTLEASDVVSPFPVEVRFSPADEVWLSPAHGRDVCHIAVHQPVEMDHRLYFELAESLFRAAGGRPHWGKLHSLTHTELAGLYPCMDRARAVRDRLDPERVMANPYTERVLG